jgi:hypothetical protein
VPGAELRILKELGVYIWPADRPDLRVRVGLAIGLLMASKARPLHVCMFPLLRLR